MVTRNLAGLYEYFSRANTRNACAANNRGGEELLESNGLSWSGSYYYNADWYWACEEMQELFRETANELADEYEAEHVDFDYVEKNTKFTLDGGITYNGVWNSTKWQMDADRNAAGKYLVMDAAPPRGFLYCSCPVSNIVEDSSKAVTAADKVKEAIAGADKNKRYTGMLFLIALNSNADRARSLLYDKKNYVENFSSGGIKEELHQKAMGFLSNFHIKYRSSRMEFLRMGE